MSMLGLLGKMFPRLVGPADNPSSAAPEASQDVTGTSLTALKTPKNLPWLALAYNANPNLITGTEFLGNWLELKNALVDPKAASCLDIRCQVTPSLPWQVQPQEGTPREAVDLVRRALERLDLTLALEQMGQASYYGLTPLEVTWRLVAGEMLPDSLESFDPWYLTFRSDRTPLVMGAPMEVGKLILHRHGGEWRNPWGLGRGRTIPRWVRVKNAVALATYRDFPNFAHDKIAFHYADDTEDAEQAKYIQIAQDCITGPAMVVPDGMKAEPIRLESKFEMGAKLIDAANAEIATGILGTTLTSSEGRHGGIGSGAASGAHERTEEQQKSTDAIRIQGTLNRTVVPWTVALNLGPDVIPPKVVFDHDISTELKDLITVLQGLNDLGLTASKAWARRVFGIPAPEDDSDALHPDPAPFAPSPAHLSFGDWTPERRLQLKRGEIRGAFAGPGDTFPIASAEDVGNAWDLAGHAADPDAVRAEIRRIAKAFGWESGLPQTAQVHLAHQVEDGPQNAHALIDAWVPGYRARAAATAHHALQALRDARDYDQAMQGILLTARDFPTSAAEWMTSGLRCARALGVYLPGTEVQLANPAWTDFGQTPDLALRWLAGKVPTLGKDIPNLDDADLRARAFWVSGVDQLSLLQDLQQGMVDALRAGTPFADFRAAWAPRLEAAGVRAGRLESAFRTNLDGAYGAARFGTLVASSAVENLTYVTAGDDRVRPEHQRLDGVTRPKDDPFWDTHVPPIDFGCRCTVTAAASDAKITPANDPRIDTPPANGFGTGGRAFADYLQNLASQAEARPDLLPPPAGAPYGWLNLSPSSTLAGKPAPLPETWSPLLQDPTGRAIAYLGDQAEVAGALEEPAEIWLQPQVTTDGRQALSLAYLQPIRDNQALVIRAMDGVVSPKGQGFLTDDPGPFRRGVRIK